MDGLSGGGAAAANNSSDFVSASGRRRQWEAMPLETVLIAIAGPQALQVNEDKSRQRRWSHCNRRLTSSARMLEDPTYAQVVRWGDEADSFVVLEVRAMFQRPFSLLTLWIE